MTEETTIAVSKGTKEEIEEYKPVADTWDDLISKIFHEWKDLHRDSKLVDMDIVKDVEQLKSDVAALKEQKGEHASTGESMRDKFTPFRKEFQDRTGQDVSKGEFLDVITDFLDERMNMLIYMTKGEDAFKGKEKGDN